MHVLEFLAHLLVLGFPRVSDIMSKCIRFIEKVGSDTHILLKFIYSTPFELDELTLFLLAVLRE